jgi:uncharacterized membrane protein YesL
MVAYKNTRKGFRELQKEFAKANLYFETDTTKKENKTYIILGLLALICLGLMLAGTLLEIELLLYIPFIAFFVVAGFAVWRNFKLINDIYDRNFKKLEKFYQDRHE